MMDVHNISSKMAGINIGVSQAHGDDRSSEEVLLTVDDKPFGMNIEFLNYMYNPQSSLVPGPRSHVQ